MAIHKLPPRKVETAKAGKYQDGGGLQLTVSKAGAKKWTLRYTLNSKRREMGLGSFPEVSLAEARDRAMKARKLAKRGLDPLKQKKTETPSFTSAAAHYIRAHRHGWKNRKHAHQWVSTLKTYARPEIGDMSVDAIGTEDVLSILQPIWTTKTETAKRVQGRIENILDYAAAKKWRDPVNPARWRGHLDKLLPSPRKVKKVKHHPAMPYDAVPDFMAQLGESTAALALKLLILTATRTNEVLGARRDEFDLEARVWTIPAGRMKAGVEHRVPLTDAALAIIEKAPQVAGNPYLFPGRNYGRPLSNMALLKVMRDLGYGTSGNKGPYVPHGFRSSFRDWAGEVSSFPRDVCEMALAHVIENKVEAAYRRGDLFEKRRKMMQEWADYLDKLKTGAMIVRINRTA